MKVCILLSTVVTWSFATGFPNEASPSYKIVDSLEDAAIYLYKQKTQLWPIEPNRYKYTLYEIDFSKSEIKEVAIPELLFSRKKSEKS